MARYEYRCESCGTFEVQMPMGTAGAAVPCKSCGRRARRSYSAPHVAVTPGPVAAARARADRSREQPEVVTAIPPRR